MVVVNPAEEDDDFELDLEAVDVVSFGPPVVFMGFIELELESIPVAMSRGWGSVVLFVGSSVRVVLVDFTFFYKGARGTTKRSLLKSKENR